MDARAAGIRPYNLQNREVGVMMFNLDNYTFFGYNMTQVLIWAIIALVALIVVIFITRLFWSWYLKLGAGLKELKKINETLNSMKR